MASRDIGQLALASVIGAGAAVVAVRLALGGESETPGNESPTADFTVSPSTPISNEQATFDASPSSDPDGSITSYQWSIEGQTFAGDTATHVFDSPGSYSVSLTVTDDDGATDSVTRSIQVDNIDPVADFTISPSNPDVGEAVTLDASQSSDPNGSIASYEWVIGSNTRTGEVVTTTFESTGTFDITVTVTDDDGATDTLSQTVSVGGGSQTLFRSFDNEEVGTQPSGTTLRQGGEPGDFTVQDDGGRRILQYSSSREGRKALSYDGIAATGVSEVWALMRSDQFIGSPMDGRIVLFATDSPLNEYGLLLDNAPTGSQDKIKVYRVVAGEFTLLREVDIAALGSDEYKEFRFRVTPGSPNRLQLRMWDEGTSEPSAWDIDVTDDALDLSSGGTQDGGWVGHVQFNPEGLNANYDEISFGVGGAEAPTTMFGLSDIN